MTPAETHAAEIIRINQTENPPFIVQQLADHGLICEHRDVVIEIADTTMPNGVQPAHQITVSYSGRTKRLIVPKDVANANPNILTAWTEQLTALVRDTTTT